MTTRVGKAIIEWSMTDIERCSYNKITFEYQITVHFQIKLSHSIGMLSIQIDNTNRISYLPSI